MCVCAVGAGKNVVVLTGDRIISSHCQSVSERNTNDVVWDGRSGGDTLIVACSQVGNTSTAAMNAFFCVNATLVDSAQLNNPMNLSHLTALFYDGLQSRRLPPLNGHHVPLESELTIYNRSKLLVNLEFCVNSLRDECREFFANYGRDGRDLRAQARFPCYYSQEKNDSVVTKFSRSAAVIEFALTAAVPGGLFIFSCSCLVLCTKVVAIGPDAHMRLTGCKNPSGDEDVLEGATAQIVELLPNNSSGEANRNGKKSSHSAPGDHNSKPLSI